MTRKQAKMMLMSAALVHMCRTNMSPVSVTLYEMIVIACFSREDKEIPLAYIESEFTFQDFERVSREKLNYYVSILQVAKNLMDPTIDVRKAGVSVALQVFEILTAQS